MPATTPTQNPQQPHLFASLRATLPSRRERGFTLIELLITITLIGTLTAIAVPNITEFRQEQADASVERDTRMTANRVIDRLRVSHDKNEDIALMDGIRPYKSYDSTAVTLYGKPNAWWAVKGKNTDWDSCYIYYSQTHEITTCATTEAPISPY